MSDAAKALAWTAAATATKTGQWLIIIKLLAIRFGPQGVGQAGNIMTLITLIDTLSGAGIFNGVNKYVSEFHTDRARLQQILGTASTIILLFSTLLACVLLLACAPLSRLLLGSSALQGVICAIAVIQFGIAGANLLRAILKGQRDATGNALAIIGGSPLGLMAYWLCLHYFGYFGALAGMALVPVLTLLPASAVFIKRRTIPLQWLKPTWHTPSAGKLFKFTLMTLINNVTAPIAFFTIRNLLVADYGWYAAGIWQGMRKISDTYFQITTAFLSVYLLPTLAYQKEKTEIIRLLKQALRFVIPLIMGVSFTTWLLRDRLIQLLFSTEFSAMRNLFSWQLSGDVLRISAAVFSSLILAKASLRLYALTDGIALMALLIFSHWLIPKYGPLGAAQAYLAAHIFYFFICWCAASICCHRT